MDLLQSLLRVFGVKDDKPAGPKKDAQTALKEKGWVQNSEGVWVEPKVTITPPGTQTPAPTATPMPPQIANASPAVQSAWRSKYQDIYDKVAAGKGISPSEYRFLIQSENGKEDPTHKNYNTDGRTVDVGLLQINTPITDTEEIKRLEDPQYNVERGLEILRQRKQNLQDPVLALGSYNLGAGGAALQPEKALNRVRDLSARFGTEVPETEFTKEPVQFVRKRMDSYKRLGLIKE